METYIQFIKSEFNLKPFLTASLTLILTYLLVKNPNLIKSTMSRFSEMLSLNSVLYQSHNPDRSQYNSDPQYKKQYKKAIIRGGFPGGLQNDGNTCFMNSVLQSLASSNEFMEFLKSFTITENEINKVPFSTSLFKLLSELNYKHGETIPTYKTNGLLKVMTDGPNKHLFMGYNQEDAQEFYQSVLKQVEKEYVDLIKNKIINDDDNDNDSDSDNSSLVNNNNNENKKKLTDKEKEELRKKLYVPFSNDLITGIDQLGHLGDVFVPVEQYDPADFSNNDKYLPFKLITPVDGLQCDRIGCIECGEMGGIRYSVTSGLGLNLPLDGANKSRFTLQELIDEWTKKEIIDGVECNRCGLLFMKSKIFEKINELNLKDEINEKLLILLNKRIVEIDSALNNKSISDEIYKKLHSENNLKKSQKVKQSFLARPPPLLCIHINRSVFDPITYMVKKNPAKIDFPMELDLSDFTATSNDINMDGRLEFRKQDDICQQIKYNKLKYKLKSVVSHFGTHNYGHYISFRKERGSWWRISDEIVRLSTEAEVLGSQGTFMLFYEIPSESDDIYDNDNDEGEEGEEIDEINPPNPEYEEEEEEDNSSSPSSSSSSLESDQEEIELKSQSDSSELVQ